MSSPRQSAPEERSGEQLEAELDQLRDRVEDLESDLDCLECRTGRAEAVVRNLLTVNVQSTPDEDLTYVAAQFAPADRDDLDDLRDDRRTAEDRLHRERAKLARRVATLEDELGIAATDALAVAEGDTGDHHLSKLGRLVRYGARAVEENPSTTTFRARELVENWNRWGTVRDDALGRERRLASRKHDLKTRLEDARNESLAWLQVYRAMQRVAEWSDGAVSLEEGSRDEGTYVLVHRLDDRKSDSDTDQPETPDEDGENAEES